MLLCDRNQWGRACSHWAALCLLSLGGRIALQAFMSVAAARAHSGAITNELVADGRAPVYHTPGTCLRHKSDSRRPRLAAFKFGPLPHPDYASVLSPHWALDLHVRTPALARLFRTRPSALRILQTLNDGTNHQPPHTSRSRNRQSWPLITFSIVSSLDNRRPPPTTYLATHADKREPCHIIAPYRCDQDPAI
ncbi:hypothetical protein T440DRAFT_155406 [Plenodomus tracheiphilus IPT5]|uniref:Secreted protein n=1 Tax=Plenodomus tracheiphilus IPT5 TaxID=1408161 RepID=A0A6A7BL00_9PLEO|nr:hypothetical protein T440DRAFT_155406 [Plenodomus tracheiphilus IPT5]